MPNDTDLSQMMKNFKGGKKLPSQEDVYHGADPSEQRGEPKAPKQEKSGDLAPNTEDSPHIENMQKQAAPQSQGMLSPNSQLLKQALQNRMRPTSEASPENPVMTKFGRDFNKQLGR